MLVRIALLCGVLLTNFLVGCAMVRSDNFTASSEVIGCPEGAIAYHLPRRRINVTVTNFTTARPNRNVLEIGSTLTPATDNRWTFCLETLNSPFSADQIGIMAPNGLLTNVFTESDDKTIVILEKTAEAVAGGIIREKAVGRSLSVAEATANKRVFGPYAVDPFDEAEMAELNRTLRTFGFCLHLDPTGDPFVPKWSPRQCGIQPSHDEAPTNLLGVGQEVLPPKPWGVLYRPIMPHRLVVLQRPDPSQKTAWQIAGSRYIHLPNAAPTLAVEVDREVFTKRQMKLTFDAGVLTNVEIQKGSELNALVTLPITLAQIAVSIPADMVKIRLATATGLKELLEAKQALIDSAAALKHAEALRAATLTEAEDKKREGNKDGRNAIFDDLTLKRRERAEDVEEFCQRIARENPNVPRIVDECRHELGTCDTQSLEICASAYLNAHEELQ